MKKKIYTLTLSMFFISLFSFAQKSNNIKIFTDGDIKFYKTLNKNRYYIENTKLNTGEVELKKLEETFSINQNRAKLRVIFEDCTVTRAKVSKSDMTETKVIQLINEYNNCASFSSNFELSESQKIEQKYALQKSIINYDIGFGYFNETIESRLNNSPEQSASNNSFSVYASFNISPAHLGSLTGKLFYDFSLQYNAGYTFNFGPIEQDVSSLFLTLTPKYYILKPTSKFNPFIGASFGAALLNFDVTDTSGVSFDNVNSAQTKFIYGFEAGAEFLQHFEFTISYLPNYKYEEFINDNAILRSRFQSLAFKLGYKF